MTCLWCGTEAIGATAFNGSMRLVCKNCHSIILTGGTPAGCACGHAVAEHCSYGCIADDPMGQARYCPCERFRAASEGQAGT